MDVFFSLVKIDIVSYLVATYLDVDECSVNNGGCHANANCQFNLGSFSCTCKPGYDGNGLDCSATKTFRTQSSLTFFHSYRSCLEDNCDDVLDFNLEIEVVTLVLFFYSDFVDVDECIINNGGCNADAICHNTEGSFTCTCKPGYSWNGSSCVGRLICQTMTKMTFQEGCWHSIINSKYLIISLC